MIVLPRLDLIWVSDPSYALFGAHVMSPASTLALLSMAEMLLRRRHRFNARASFVSLCLPARHQADTAAMPLTSSALSSPAPHVRCAF